MSIGAFRRKATSPFESLPGREVRGPLNLLHMNWENHKESDPESVIEYMNRLQNTLQKNLKAAQTKQKDWYDRKARERTFRPEDEVLLLGPAKGHKLQLAWEGSYKVVKNEQRE